MIKEQETIKQSSEFDQKSSCTYLKSVNHQNKSRFANLAVTGVVDVQCDHSIVRSVVDLQKGER